MHIYTHMCTAKSKIMIMVRFEGIYYILFLYCIFPTFADNIADFYNQF